jgi:hypothetical protein
MLKTCVFVLVCVFRCSFAPKDGRYPKGTGCRTDAWVRDRKKGHPSFFRSGRVRKQNVILFEPSEREVTSVSKWCNGASRRERFDLARSALGGGDCVGGGKDRQTPVFKAREVSNRKRRSCQDDLRSYCSLWTKIAYRMIKTLRDPSQSIKKAVGSLRGAVVVV